MAVRSDLDSEHPLVVFTAAGTPTPADWRDCVASAVADPTLPWPAAVLLDLERADRGLRHEDIATMTHVIHRLSARFAGRVAVLTAAAVHAAPAALLAGYADGVRYRVKAFTDRPAARSWLSRDT
jgi:hypothetical protein